MIPCALTELYDPPPDHEQDDARHETLAPPGPDFSDEEWAELRGSDFDDYQVSVPVSERSRHRAAGGESQRRLW